MRTVHLRRTTLRSLYRTLHELDATITDPSQPLGLPSKPRPGTRPLTDTEIALTRTAALARARARPTRAAAAVALAEATATTSELAELRWHHIDLDHGTVILPGADPVQARTGTLTTWGVGVLHRHATTTTTITVPEGCVLERRHPESDPHVAQAAMSNLLARLFSEAGIHDPAVKPASIRLWGARQHLDRAADTLEHRWQQP